MTNMNQQQKTNHGMLFLGCYRNFSYMGFGSMTNKFGSE